MDPLYELLPYSQTILLALADLDSLPRSIAATSVALAGTVTSVTLGLTSLVRDVRDARGDIEHVSRELQSLKLVLELVAEDATHPFPPALESQIKGVLSNCSKVVQEIGACVDKHQGSRAQKGLRWVAKGRDEMSKLRSLLEAHKSTFNLLLEMINATTLLQVSATTQSIGSTAQGIRDDTLALRRGLENIQIDSSRIPEIFQLLAEIQSRLATDGTENPRASMLQTWLEEISTTYAGSVVGDLDTGRAPESEESSSVTPASSRSPESLQANDANNDHVPQEALLSPEALQMLLNDKQAEEAHQEEDYWEWPDISAGPQTKGRFFGVDLARIPRGALRVFKFGMGESRREYLIPQVLYECGHRVKSKGKSRLYCRDLFEKVYRGPNTVEGLKRAFEDIPDSKQVHSLWFKPNGLTNYSPYEAAWVVREFIHRLPEPLIDWSYTLKLSTWDPTSMHYSAERAARTPKMPAHKEILENVSLMERGVLIFILDLLAKIAHQSKDNKMTPEKLATLFPNLLSSHRDPSIAYTIRDWEALASATFNHDVLLL
ncbi:hypothetical protein FDECE_13637 [Fusarium decemcellulare]|nr:hypothetical protein FDECE_13637 [Fusarium decemcellulare]